MRILPCRPVFSVGRMSDRHVCRCNCRFALCLVFWLASICREAPEPGSIWLPESWRQRRTDEEPGHGFCRAQHPRNARSACWEGDPLPAGLESRWPLCEQRPADGQGNGLDAEYDEGDLLRYAILCHCGYPQLLQTNGGSAI